MYSFSHR